MLPTAPDIERPDTSQAPATETPESNRVIGGVGAFVGERLGVDPLWVRLGLVVLALLDGVGLLLYAGLWLVFIAGRSLPWLRYAGGALLIVGLPLALSESHPLNFVDGPVAIVALLAGLALALWQPRTSAVDTEPAAMQWQAPVVARAPKPPPSPLGRAALALALAVAAVGALIDKANGGRLHPEQWLGAAAVVCGIGLLVGIFVGHARWLIVPAILFGLAGWAWGVCARLGVPITERGDSSASIDTTGLFGTRDMRVAHGSASLWVGGAPASVVRPTMRVAFGDVDITSNGLTTIEIHADVDDGSIMMSTQGSHRVGDVITIGPDGAPSVIVDVRIGHGNLTINEYAEPVNTGDGDPFSPGATSPDVPGLPTTVLPGGTVPGQLTQISEALAITSDGWIVIDGGVAVIDAEDRVVVGQVFDDGFDGQAGDSDVIDFAGNLGTYRLLPRSLLITPTGEVIDLQALRASVVTTTTTPVATTPTPTNAVSTSTVPATSTTVL